MIFSQFIDTSNLHVSLKVLISQIGKFVYHTNTFSRNNFKPVLKYFMSPYISSPGNYTFAKRYKTLTEKIMQKVHGITPQKYKL